MYIYIKVCLLAGFFFDSFHQDFKKLSYYSKPTLFLNNNLLHIFHIDFPSLLCEKQKQSLLVCVFSISFMPNSSTKLNYFD